MSTTSQRSKWHWKPSVSSQCDTLTQFPLPTSVYFKFRERKLVRGPCDWNLLHNCQISRPTGAGPIHCNVWLTWSLLLRLPESVHITAVHVSQVTLPLPAESLKRAPPPFSIGSHIQVVKAQSVLPPPSCSPHSQMTASCSTDQSGLNKILPQLLH